jgi:hypothetical protein
VTLVLYQAVAELPSVGVGRRVGVSCKPLWCLLIGGLVQLPTCNLIVVDRCDTPIEQPHPPASVAKTQVR